MIQLFSGVMEREAIQPILDLLTLKLPDALLIGATTAGEISNGKMSSGEIVISFSIFDSTKITTQYYAASDFQSGIEAAKNIVSENTKACIVLSEGLKSDAESFLNGFTSIRNDIVLAGGNAGDDLTFTRTYIFENNHIYEEGVVIAILESDTLQVHNGYSLNWTSVGKEMTVTHAEKNIIFEIDNRPVRDLYIHYLGSETVAFLPASAIEFPLIKIVDGIPIARSIIGQSEDGGFVYAGHFNNGDKVRFAIGNVEEILHRAIEVQNQVKSLPVEATYIYSCSVRKLFLKEQLNYELGLIDQIAPTIGFFTYGEFFHAPSSNQLLNITTTTLSLSESTKLQENFANETQENHHSMLKSLTHLVNVTQDELDASIRELVEKESTIKNQLKDPLTGLYNRTALMNDLEKRPDEVMLILINIDRFSVINDYYGYEIGDCFLASFSERLQETIDHHYLYRINSDEFAILCNHEFDQNMKEHVLEHINDLENHTYRVDDYDLTVSISGGIAYAKSEEVYNLAHMALKEAKEKRLNVVFYNENKALSEKAHNNILMINKIKLAIEEDRIVPFFQGIVDNRTGKIVKYESLIRLMESDGTVLTPYRFLEHAKKAKLYEKLTQIMIEKSLQMFESLPFELSLNLTLADIVSNETRTYIYNKLKHSTLSHRLVFEIVESEGIESFEEVIEFIKTVKHYGCKIAIDDFGTGYSNFSYLSKLDVDYIKIDGSLIKQINIDTDHLFTVESILFFANKKGIHTIAEFVEDDLIFRKLCELGIDFSQGYLFSKPSPVIIN
ncbi:MAG: EAL domain-containing protein [Sulfuricurvum sp.]|nr:EAL domain-containing protein [Sulfuricurvum sp.]